ncbi:hypothetical protein JX265_011992 [Neoarthrinium moseri]|uniref:Heterokaryon incompatibility domain-containing protein n=1 Tax=Neoarthrinium moseri TaxID=1658444 RepID=A0A9P9WB90_9PEZI|nr:hypothetical protein JX265_011992 [Neoarthrinium moseri]
MDHLQRVYDVVAVYLPFVAGTPRQDRLCDACKALNLNWFQFIKRERPPTTEEMWMYDGENLDLGNLRDIFKRRSKCAFCRLVCLTVGMKSRSQLPKSSLGYPTTLTLNYGPGSHEPLNLQSRWIDLHVTTFSPAIDFTTMDTIITHNPGTGLLGRFLEGRSTPPLVDGMLLRRWLHWCQSWHGDKCKTPISVPEGELDIWLVDCHEACLVKLPITTSYLALSYVWGRRKGFCTTKATLARLGQTGGLLKYSWNFGDTVTDAIRLVRKMRMRYLWVDRLCIVQDDDTSKAFFLRQMARIYARAEAVIIAMHGSNGEVGLAGVTRRRKSKQAVAKIDDLLSLTILRNENQQRKSSTYSTRAWTYQEEELASRRIYFYEDEVTFECGEAMFRESVCWENPQVKHKYWSNRHLQFEEYGPMSLLDGYSRIVGNISSRHLTVDTDILDTFLGLANRYEAALRTRIIYGIPLSNWDCAIHWRPSGDGLSRRKGGFPSWSWCGWVGSVDLRLYKMDVAMSKWIQRYWIQWYLDMNDGKGVQGLETTHFFQAEHTIHQQSSTNLSVEPVAQLAIPAGGGSTGGNTAPLLRFWTLCGKFKVRTSTEWADSDLTSWFLEKQRQFPLTGVYDKDGVLCGTVRMHSGAEFENETTQEFALISGTNLARGTPLERVLKSLFNKYHYQKTLDSTGAPKALPNAKGQLPQAVSDRIFQNEPLPEVQDPGDYLTEGRDDVNFSFYNCWLITPHPGGSDGIYERKGGTAVIYRGAVERCMSGLMEWKELAVG